MKKFILFELIIFFLSSPKINSQSGWVNKFIHDPNIITTIITNDSIDYFCFSMNNINIGTTYLKSINYGSNWLTYKLNDSSFDIRGGTFVNSHLGWIVGSNGYSYSVIYKTTNSGVNWERQYCDPSVTMCWSVFFYDQNTGWIGGNPGKLFRTTNNGTNWILQSFTGAGIIRRIYFKDINNGWFAADNGYLGKTTNSGINWTNIAINTPFGNKILQDFCFIDSSNFSVLAIGIYPDPNAYIYRTTDAGTTWFAQYTYTNGQNSYFYGIHFTDISTGFTWGGSNLFMKTTNSGLNWNILMHPGYFNIYSLFFNNNKILSAGGNSDYTYSDNYILKSTDTGSNWFINNHNWNYHFRNITFTETLIGYAVSDSGRIFKTTNSGLNWYLCYQNNLADLRSIAFANNLNGCVVGYVFNSTTKMILTNNAGNTWQEISIPSIYDLNVVQYLNSATILASGYNNCVKSTDGGINWHICQVPININNTFLYDMSFVNANTGFILGYACHYDPPHPCYYLDDVFKSTDGGDNWILIMEFNSGTLEHYSKFQMLDGGVGYILKQYYGFFKTTDWGVTWIDHNFESNMGPTCIKMINSITGWIGAGNNSQSMLFKTTNGGDNWIQQFNDYYKFPRSIFAFDENNAWFCGDYSSIYNTTNGGGVLGISSSMKTNCFKIFQNYPNPFNPVTTIKYELPSDVKVTIKIYDILGRLVTTLVNGEFKKAGYYEAKFEGTNYASGVYFYRIEAGKFIQSKKMVLVK